MLSRQVPPQANSASSADCWQVMWSATLVILCPNTSLKLDLDLHLFHTVCAPVVAQVRTLQGRRESFWVTGQSLFVERLEHALQRSIVTAHYGGRAAWEQRNSQATWQNSQQAGAVTDLKGWKAAVLASEQLLQPVTQSNSCKTSTHSRSG